MLFELLGHLVLHLLGKRLHGTALARFVDSVRHVLLALVFFGAMAFVGNLALQQGREWRLRDAEDVRALATITDKIANAATPTDRRRAPTYVLTYSFATTTGVTVSSSARVGPDIYNTTSVGERTPVTYTRSNPQKNQLGTYHFDITLLVSAWVVSALLAVLALGQVVWLLPARSGRDQRQAPTPSLRPYVVRIIIALAIAGYVGRLSWSGWQQEVDLARNGVIAEATIDQRWMERSNLNPAYRISYTLRTREGNQIAGETLVPHFSYLRLAPGTRTQGYYSSRTPSLNGIGPIPRTAGFLNVLSTATLAALGAALWQAGQLVAVRRERRRLMAMRNEILSAGVWNQPAAPGASDNHLSTRTAPVRIMPAANRSRVVERMPSLMHRIFG